MNLQGHFPEAEKDPVIQIASMVTVQGEDRPTVRNVMTLKGCAPIVGSEVMSFEDEVSLLRVSHPSLSPPLIPVILIWTAAGVPNEWLGDSSDLKIINLLNGDGKEGRKAFFRNLLAIPKLSWESFLQILTLLEQKGNDYFWTKRNPF